MTPQTWMVVIDGAGEYKDDYEVIFVEAETPAHAVEIVTAPENGWGKSEDGVAFVMRPEHVSTFTINETRRKTARPATLEEAAELQPLKKFSTATLREDS